MFHAFSLDIWIFLTPSSTLSILYFTSDKFTVALNCLDVIESGNRLAFGSSSSESTISLRENKTKLIELHKKI